MNHLAYFGFNDDPFRMTPDRDFFYASGNHTSLAETIKFGLKQGDGFIIALGEVGTGKTMLLRMLMGELDLEFETAFLVSPHLTPKQLLLAILCDIGLEERGHSRMSLDHLLRILNNYLFTLSKKGKRLLIIIDEAQNLPDESIEQLRLLSNFESDKSKWLQIILVGQPELKVKVEQKHLRQLLQRVTVMETLYPLTEKEMALYVHFRLNKAGRGDLRLDKKARRELWRYSGGVPRLINKLMSRVLLVSYARQGDFNRKVILEAAESLHLKKKGWFGKLSSGRWFIPLAAALLIALSFIVTRPHELFLTWLER